MHKSIAVIGAGLSGLAALRGLQLAGHEVICLEAGDEIGGSWRYENSNGVSAAYRSLHTNVSRRNMRYRSLRIPGRAVRRVHHTDLLAYLERYVQVNELARQIHLRATVRQARQSQDGSWVVEVKGEPSRRFDALVVATGCFWDPNVPQIPGVFSGQALHARDYRAPEPFAGKRVLVIGAGQSALDIAAEISFGGARTTLACRQGHHLFPAQLLGLPIDYLDVAILNRIPWPVVRRLTQSLLTASPAAPDRGELPKPQFTILEHRWPALVTPNIERALAQRTLTLRSGVESLDGEQVTFTDGNREPFDTIIYATGYRINFPFLPEHLGRGRGVEFPLYRRILSPHAKNLAFIGAFDAGPGRLEITEIQADWLAATLAGRLKLPDHDAIWKAIDACGERRTQQRFASSGRHTILCDRHAYLQTLRRDLATSRR